MEDDTPTQQPKISDSGFKELEVEVNQKDRRIRELENEANKKEDGIQDMEVEINDIKIQLLSCV